MESFIRWLLLLVCMVGWSGCLPQTVPDEQKEPNYLVGKSRAQDRDYDGAIEAFEKALEVNPHSSAAHFELAVIYEQFKNDYASALYHYQKTRSLKPEGSYAEIAQARMELCKRELAKSVGQTPTVEYMQREIDRLMYENQRLKQTVIDWQNYYYGKTNSMPGAIQFSQVVQSNQYNAGAARTGGSSNVTPGGAGGLASDGSSRPNGIAGGSGSGAGRAVAPPVNPPKPVQRTHTVAAGDSPAKIANKYGVKLNSLRAANPTMDDRKLKVGQVLTIPAQ